MSDKMADAEQQTNEETEHQKEAFYANNFTLWASEWEVNIDFAQFLGRMDNIGGKRIPTIVTKHQPIIMTAVVAKQLYQTLMAQIDSIEKANGEIKLPEQPK